MNKRNQLEKAIEYNIQQIKVTPKGKKRDKLARNLGYYSMKYKKEIGDYYRRTWK